MNLGIVGSREFNDYITFKKIVVENFNVPNIKYIVSGGAKGSDALAERFADENNIKKLIFKPDWEKHGKKAGFVRNVDIIKNSDYVIAFWNGKSKGTKHDITIAMNNSKPLFIFLYEKNELQTFNVY